MSSTSPEDCQRPPAQPRRGIAKLFALSSPYPAHCRRRVIFLSREIPPPSRPPPINRPASSTAYPFRHHTPRATHFATNHLEIAIAAAVLPASPCTTAATAAATHIQYFQQQQQQQEAVKKQKSFQFDQTPGGEQFHIEVPALSLPRAGGGCAKEVISFSFDNNSVCTSSAATSFFTSISSQLISMSDAATSSAAAAAKKQACGGKRGDDGKCHCPKKKSVPFILPPHRLGLVLLRGDVIFDVDE